MNKRDFLRVTGAGAMALGLGIRDAHAQAQKLPYKGPYNFLFILTDQERFFRPGELPEGYRLPAHERLAKRGTTFVNHRSTPASAPRRAQCSTPASTSSTRGCSTTPTFPGSAACRPRSAPSATSCARRATTPHTRASGTSPRNFETVNKLAAPTRIFTKEMEDYGFSDYFGIGDIIAHTQGGYLHDGVIASMGGSWLRGKGRELAAQGKPWFLAVNLVNPHDVMFYDTDAPGTPLRPERGITHVARDPVDPLYAKKWSFKLPASHAQALDAPGRPRAHRDFLRSHDALVGEISDEEPRWRRRHNYYLNCLRDVDRNIAALLAELDASGLAERTIVILTADHGDMDGAHQLHAKGAVAYREQNHAPLIVAHPAYPGGRRCRAVTSHLDIAPTLVAMSGVAPEKRAAIVKGLPGKDFSGVLADPEKAAVVAVRDGALFNYNMFAYLDGDYLPKAVEHMRKAGNPKELKAAGIVPDIAKRGAVRSVYDERYVFARYFSPKQHNRPTSLEELFRFNDVELYDVQTDPYEMKNLAANRELVAAMNEKLNRLIDAEVGEDRGQMLPGGIDAGWEVNAETMAS